MSKLCIRNMLSCVPQSYVIFCQQRAVLEAVRENCGRSQAESDESKCTCLPQKAGRLALLFGDMTSDFFHLRWSVRNRKRRWGEISWMTSTLRWLRSSGSISRRLRTSKRWPLTSAPSCALNTCHVHMLSLLAGMSQEWNLAVQAADALSPEMSAGIITRWCTIGVQWGPIIMYLCFMPQSVAPCCCLLSVGTLS